MFFKICNNLLNAKYSLLGSTEGELAKKFGDNFWNTALSISSWVLGFVGLLAGVWGIYCAAEMMRADTPEKKESAKKRLTYTICGVVIAVMLIIILLFVKENISKWVGGESGNIFPEQ